MSVQEILDGNVRATARLIRRIDDGEADVFDDLMQLYPHAGKAHVIGFTGSPGVGKSTLVDRIVAAFRQNGKTVGVLAVDPTSPFSGGAILGDRIRMQNHFLDKGVFIRSMATRGAFGGLTRSTADAVVVLDAMGKDVIIVETVGVGQDEVEIAHSAHTTVLVTIPGMGDDIQAIKAGLMEIGDLFVVNKADRDGVAKTVREVKFMLELSADKHEKTGWYPPVLPVTAVAGEGIDELYQSINDHWDFLQREGGTLLRNREIVRVKNQLCELLKEHLMNAALEQLGGEDALYSAVEEIADRKSDPYRVCRELVKDLLGGNTS